MIRALLVDDDPDLARLLTDYLGERPILSANKCTLRRVPVEANTDWHQDGAFLGMCGLHHQETYPDEVEVGWRLAHAHWGHGYATEASAALLDHAFTTMRLRRSPR